MQNLQRFVLVIIAVGAIAIGISWLWDLREERVRAREEYKAREAQNAERAKSGPYLEFNKMISPTEKVSIVVIPHPWGDLMDKRCLVYLNTEYKTSSMNCDFETMPPDVRPSAGLFDDIVSPNAEAQYSE